MTYAELTRILIIVGMVVSYDTYWDTVKSPKLGELIVCTLLSWAGLFLTLAFSFSEPE